ARACHRALAGPDCGRHRGAHRDADRFHGSGRDDRGGSGGAADGARPDGGDQSTRLWLAHRPPPERCSIHERPRVVADRRTDCGVVSRLACRSRADCRRDSGGVTVARAGVSIRSLALGALVAVGAVVAVDAVVAIGAFGVAHAAAVPDAALDALRPDAPRQNESATPPAWATLRSPPMAAQFRRFLTEFAIAAAPREFEFPRDHGPHPDFRQEWWYLTGNLTATDGERFGFELTIFRVALAPAVAMPPATATDAASQRVGATATGAVSPAERGAATPAASPWRTRQVYVGHFAVTDVAKHTFRFAQKYERDALGLAGAVADPFRVWLDDWQIGGSPHWTVHAQQKDYELQL